MRSIIILGVAAMAMTSAGAASAATSAKIKNAVVRVTIVPEARADVKVEYLTTNPSLPLVIRTAGDKLIIDGGLKNKIRGCRSDDSRERNVKVRGLGMISWNNIPQIVIRTPMNVNVDAGGASFGSVGRSDNLDLGVSGCGDWNVANVKGKLGIGIAGSGDVVAGTAGSLSTDIAGSGDVKVKAVAGGADIDIAGSGDVRVDAINGPLDVGIAGSGDVAVLAGQATSVEVDIAGSGEVSFDGVAQTLDVSIAGAGDVKIGKVTGAISRSVVGSGSIYVNGEQIRKDRP